MVDITSQMNTKIRLVRCPRCRKVLPELPDIPVYKCGACGTILKAKNRQNDIKEAVSSSHETNSSQNDEDESVSDSSNQETTPVSESSPGSEFKGDNFEIENDKQPGTNFCDEHLTSTELSSHGNERLLPEARESTEQGEHKNPLGEDARKDGNESLNRNVQQPEHGISSDELPNSDDLSFRKKEYSSPEIREPMMQSEDRSSLTENIGKYAKESQDDNSEQTGEKKSSDELHSSAELSRQNIETSSPKVSECIQLNGPEDLSELYPSRDQDECRDCKADKPEGNNFLAIVPLTGEGNHQSELSPGGGAHIQRDGSIYNSEKNNGESQHEFPGQIEESSQNIEFVREASSTAPDACHKVETSSVISKTHTDVNEDSVSHFKSSNLEDSLSLEKEDDVLVAAESPLNEGNLSENLSADISVSHLKMSHVEGSLSPEKRDVLVATERLLNEGNLSENLSPDNSVSHFETSNVEGSLSPEKGDVLVAAESPLNEANLSENLFADISVSHLKMSHVEGSFSLEKRDVLVATESLLNEGNLSENLSPDNSVSHFETSNVEGSLSPEKGDVLVAAESPLNEANLSENLFADISVSHLKMSHVEGSFSLEKRDVLVATESLLNEGNLSENLSPDNSVSHFETSNVEGSLSPEKGDVLVAAESPLNEANLSENLFADISVSHLKMSHVEGSLSPEKRDVLVATESLLNEGNLSENLSLDNSVSHFETSNVEGSLSPEKGDVLVAAESPLNEANLSEYLSPDEYLEQSQKNVQGFDRVSSGESLVGLPIIPRYTPGAMYKSPTRIYYGDSSVSSYDGNEDQPSDQPSHLYKGKFKATDVLSTHRSRRTDGLRAKKMQDSELEMHHEQIASSSKFKEKNSPAIIGREWIHDELPRPRGQSPSIFAEMNNQAITGREWSHDELPHVRGQSHATRRRFDNNDLISKKLYVSRGSQLVHGNGSPSSYRHNVFHHHSGFNSPDTKSYVEPDKMELLRMVYELEDKLNKTRISERMENGRFSSGVRGYEKHIPTRYDDLATEGNVYADFANFKYHDSFSQGIGWPQRSKVSRMAFSGEAAYGRHQVDCLCSHCSPQDWQWSRQFPSHYSSHSKRQYSVHPGHHRHEAFPSRSSTPRHYTSSEFSSWDQEIKSENQKYKEHEQRRLYLNVAKRHLRPTAGGAPIIACSHCSELLQLPMDFLVLRKRCHQLRCNSCNRILKFSLQKKVHLVPHVPNPSTPPPSEIDHDSGVANSRTLASSHSNHHPPQAEPVSCSEDYDLSFCRSCSTEREPSMATPASHSLQKNTHKGKMPSGDSYQSVEDRNTNAVSRNFRSKGKNSGEAFESVETSSKISKWGTSCSEIQEVPAASGSPLHKLMGYSSPSHVLFASPGDESEEEMTYRNQHM